MKNEIIAQLSSRHPWSQNIHYFDTIGSTNDEAKRMALDGAPHGTVVIADRQTGGRGRLGRSFHSPGGTGIYLSVILRPECKISELMHLTCAAAVAASGAVFASTGVQPRIKWTNDLIFGSKKLAGILTEPFVGYNGQVPFAIVGIGINCNQRIGEFPPELGEMACSLSMITGKPIDRSLLAANLIRELEAMSRLLLSDKARIMDSYRGLCATIGQEVSVHSFDQVRHGRALGIDDNGALLVRFADGHTEAVSAGEVSVRGMYGYV